MTLLESSVRTPLAQAIGWTLFHSLWEGAIVAAFLAAYLTVVRPARARYTAACLALGALLVAFAVTLIELMPHTQIRTTGVNPVLPTGNTGVPDPLSGHLPLRLESVLPWLAPFWILGVLLFYLRQLAGWMAARRLRRTGVCCAPEFWQQRLRQLAARLRVSRQVSLLESSLAGVPVVIGHLRPVILMPVGLLTGLPIEQLEAILLHELAHVRRYDYLVNLVQTAVESLLFYHPVVWWMARVIRTEREHCADDVAAALSTSAYDYAEALAALEQTRRDTSEPALAATGGNLVKRIRRLLITTGRPRSLLAPAISAGILLLAATAVLMAWQANPEVSPYTKWLNEDVVYIITAQERAVFQSLETNEDREHFIAQFWLRRDPTPGTPENEYKDEHYRRIRYANLHFPTAQGLAGWKTDRGRIYITFGPPDEREERPNGDASRPYPWERWKYNFIQGFGANVFMEFIDPNGKEEFHMTRDPNPPR
jgi:GWxTD domain-containing protein